MTTAITPFNVKLLQLTDVNIRSMRPITTSDTFDGATKNFNTDGLFSNEIFGMNGSKERMRRFAYIDVKIPLIHPLVYRTLGKLKRIYPEIISGRTYAVFNEETMDFEKSNSIDGGTGYAFFMQYYDKVTFPQRLSDLRALSIKFIERTRITSLNTRVIVAPAGFRDYVIIDDREEEDEINKVYRKLLASANAVTPEMFAMNPKAYDRVRFTMQGAFNAIYEYYENMIRGKNKLLLGHVMTRQVRDGTRNVFTTQNLDVKELFSKDAPDTNSTGIGLFQFLKAYRPKCLFHIANGYLSQVVRGFGAPVRLVNKKTWMAEEVLLPDELYNQWIGKEAHEKLINLFSEEERRHEPVTISDYYLALAYNDGKVFKLFGSINELPEGFSRKHVRPVTFAEFLYSQVYQIEHEVTLNVTRFPVTGFGSIYPSIPFLKPTTETLKLIPLDDSWAPDQMKPVMREMPLLGSAFMNTLMPSPDKLAGMTADFDGDKGTGNGLMLTESVKESKAIMSSRAFHIKTDGSIAHSLSTDTVNFLLGAMTGPPKNMEEAQAKWDMLYGQKVATEALYNKPPIVPINVTKLDHQLISKIRMYQDLLKPLCSWVLLPDRNLLPSLKQLAAVMRKLQPYPKTVKVYRGFDSDSGQETLGFGKDPKMGEKVTFTSPNRGISTSIFPKVSGAYGNTLVEITLNSDKDDFLILSDELYYVIAEMSKNPKLSTEGEIIILPPVGIKATVVDTAASQDGPAIQDRVKTDSTLWSMAKFFGSAFTHLTGLSLEGVDENPEGVYQEAENSVFSSEGKNYSVNKLLQIAATKKVNIVPLSKMDWVLPFSTPDEARVEDADITTPIIVTPYKAGTYLVADGLHRLTAAWRQGVQTLPAYKLTAQEMSQALIP